jgi:CheY-specific phosphatase CheX
MNPANNVDAEEQAAIRTMVIDSCTDFFATFELPVRVLAPNERTPPAPHGDHDIAGFIGFAGPVRGSLTIAGSTGLFSSTYPAEVAAKPGPGELFDWTGEMANQLLGRIKRRFCARGADFAASTPTAVRGRDIGRRSPVRNGTVDLQIDVGGEVMWLCFEVSPPPSGKIFNESAEPVECSPEGELMLF